MPVNRLVKPDVVISFLMDKGWRVQIERDAASALVHPECDYPLIVPTHDLLRPSEVADIMEQANIPLSEFEIIL